jgi:hypothetical protein
MSRIDNSLASQRLQQDLTAQATGAFGQTTTAAALATDAALHTTAPEIQQALASLSQIPEIRPEVLSRAISRLNDGQLVTTQAAQQTAQAILSNFQAFAPAGQPTLEATPTAPAAPTSPASGTTPTSAPDLLQLLDILRQIPVLRQEVVAEVAQRLTNGQLTTPAATDQTVKAILATTGSNG